MQIWHICSEEIRLSCLIFNKVMDIIYETHHHRIESWDQIFLSPNQLHNYAALWYSNVVLLWVCGWDCEYDSSTKVQSAVMYNGHKRVHVPLNFRA